jgi:hypothetical protein
LCNKSIILLDVIVKRITLYVFFKGDFSKITILRVVGYFAAEPEGTSHASTSTLHRIGIRTLNARRMFREIPG